MGVKRSNLRCARPAPLLTAPPGSEAMRPPKTTPQTFFSYTELSCHRWCDFIQVYSSIHDRTTPHYPLIISIHDRTGYLLFILMIGQQSCIQALFILFKTCPGLLRALDSCGAGRARTACTWMAPTQTTSIGTPVPSEKKRCFFSEKKRCFFSDITTT